MSDKALVKVGAASTDLITFDRAQIDLIKRTVAYGATDDELNLFLHQCRRTGLDPLAKQIYFRKQRTKNGDQVTVITGIDGYRLIADRTGKYAGNDDPVFDDEDAPRKATVTVYKIIANVRCPFTSSARWDQYYPGDAQGFMWRKMPHLMLGKCAEALALRKAFPAELSGMYVQEEMDQAKVRESAQDSRDDVGDAYENGNEQGESEKSEEARPASLRASFTKSPDRGATYNPERAPDKAYLMEQLVKRGIPVDLFDNISAKMRGKYADELTDVAAEVIRDSSGL